MHFHAELAAVPIPHYNVTRATRANRVIAVVLAVACSRISIPSRLVGNKRLLHLSLPRFFHGHTETLFSEIKMELHPEDVHVFADTFGALNHDPRAVRSPHLQTGGFIWSDETPDLHPRDDFPVSITRFMIALISYRNTLMRGVPHAPFTPYWNAFHECCPTWPGFRSERFAPQLIPELDCELNGELDKLKRMLKICERRRAT